MQACLDLNAVQQATNSSMLQSLSNSSFAFLEPINPCVNVRNAQINTTAEYTSQSNDGQMTNNPNTVPWQMIFNHLPHLNTNHQLQQMQLRKSIQSAH